MQKIQLTFPSNRSLFFYLTRKKVKNINLKITADALVQVSAPAKTSLEFIKSWLISKENWLFKNLNKVTLNQQVANQHSKISANTILLLGVPKSLQIVAAPKVQLQVQEDNIVLKLPENKLATHPQFLARELRKFAYQTFQQLLDEFEPLLREHQLPYPNLKVRKMRARWGSCHLFSQTITLNTSLIHAPSECIRYVLCHEFAHLKHFHHRQPFYNFLSQLYPNWREQRNILNRHYKFILD